jgi:hypothetical protein
MPRPSLQRRSATAECGRLAYVAPAVPLLSRACVGSSRTPSRAPATASVSDARRSALLHYTYGATGRFNDRGATPQTLSTGQQPTNARPPVKRGGNGSLLLGVIVAVGSGTLRLQRPDGAACRCGVRRRGEEQILEVDPPTKNCPWHSRPIHRAGRLQPYREGARPAGVVESSCHSPSCASLDR